MYNCKQCIIEIHTVDTDCYINALFSHSGHCCGIYTTSNADTCQYIANDCKANVVMVEDDTQLQKFLKVCEKNNVCIFIDNLSDEHK